jgi:hypothetical protein
VRFELEEATWGDGWCIQWQGDDGRRGFLGKVRLSPMAELVTRAVCPEVEPVSCSEGRFVWATKAQAARAMRLARLRVREVKEGCQWPSWAHKAIAEGWKPPKRWRPPVKAKVE